MTTAPGWKTLPELHPAVNDRLVIGGGPRTGKTSAANLIASLRDVTALHTDDLIDSHDWSGASAAAAQWMAEPGPWVIEGVATARALRKALEATEAAPCDTLVWFTDPHEELTKGQATMAKGCETVLDGIVMELLRRGVTIIRWP